MALKADRSSCCSEDWMDTRRGPEVCRMRLPLDLDDHNHQHCLASGYSSGPASEELLAQRSHHRVDHQDLGLP